MKLFYCSVALGVVHLVMAGVFYFIGSMLTFWSVIIMGIAYSPMIWFTWYYRRHIIEEFDGFVESIDNDVAYITLTKGDEVSCGQYDANKLIEYGVRERRRFICRTVSCGNNIDIEFEPINDVVVSDAELEEINQRVLSLCEGEELDGDEE